LIKQVGVEQNVVKSKPPFKKTLEIPVGMWDAITISKKRASAEE